MQMPIAFLDLGAPELLILLAIAVLLFGGKKLPELSRSLGQSIKELKNGFGEAKGLQQDVRTQVSQTKEALHGTEATEPTRVQ